MIIDPKSISYSQIKQNIQDFILKKPDQIRWKDFYESSAGVVITELISGMLTTLLYKNAANRRETYLFHAKQRSSAIGIASGNHGYSAFRGRCNHLTLDITPSVSIAINKYSIVGSCNNLELVALEDSVLSVGGGVQQLKVAIGNINSETKIAPSNELRIFRFISDNMSDDVRILVDSEEVEYKDKLIQLIEGNYVALSNPYGGVDVIYLNEGENQYSTGTEITVEFIELANTEFTQDSLSFLYGEIESFIINFPYAEPEPIEEIKINGPLSFETQSAIRGRNDYLKKFKALDTKIISTNGSTISPAVVGLTYVRNDYEFFTQEEKDAFKNQLYDDYAFFGNAPPVISDPVIRYLEFDVNIRISNESVLISTVNEDVNTVFKIYDGQLGSTIDLDKIEHGIEELDYTKVARIRPKIVEWLPNSEVLSGQFVSISGQSDLIAICSQSGTTDEVEPFFELGMGLYTEDGTAQWQTVSIDGPFQNGWDEYPIISFNLQLR